MVAVISDRVESAIVEWQKREQQLKQVFTREALEQKDFFVAKLHYYRDILQKVKPDATAVERMTLSILKGEIKLLERRLFKNPLKRTMDKIQYAVKVRKLAQADKKQTGERGFLKEVSFKDSGGIERQGIQPPETNHGKIKISDKNNIASTIPEELKTRNDLHVSPVASSVLNDDNVIYHTDSAKSLGGAKEDISELIRPSQPELEAFLEQARLQGYKWVAWCPEEGIPGTDDLQLFKSRYEAAAYCYEQSTDFDKYHSIPIDNAAKFILEFNQTENLTTKSFDMKESNYEYLAKQVKFTGFGEDEKGELKQAMESGVKDFTLLRQTSYGKDHTVSALYFKKSEQSENYFFNRYDFSLKAANGTDMLKRTFYIDNTQPTITQREAYNLMNGRAVFDENLVNKNGDKYEGWRELDFKNTDAYGNFKMKIYHENYGFRLENELAKHPIKELMADEQKKELMASLQRGNRQQVTFNIDGQERKLYVEAAPKYKSINIYDENMVRLQPHELYKGKNVNQDQQKQGLSDQQRVEGEAGAQKQGNANKPANSKEVQGKQAQGIKPKRFKQGL